MSKPFNFISLLIFLACVLSFDAFCCTKVRDRINTFYNSRKHAFGQAKKDAKIPSNAQPIKVDHVPLRDLQGQPVFKDGRRAMAREYHFKNADGDHIVISEHTLGHVGAAAEAGAMPHLNVNWGHSMNRPGSVPGTSAHYNIEW